jgi:hypothetical protein
MSNYDKTVCHRSCECTSYALAEAQYQINRVGLVNSRVSYLNGDALFLFFFSVLLQASSTASESRGFGRGRRESCRSCYCMDQ